MDGFVASAIDGNHTSLRGQPVQPGLHRRHRTRPARRHGLDDEREIPNYRAYADRYVLQDHMFESRCVRWSLPSHLSDGLRVVGDLLDAERPDELHHRPRQVPDRSGGTHCFGSTPFAWTDITYLPPSGRRELEVLRRGGNAARLRGRCHVLCAADADDRHPEIWNPLPGFEDVDQDGQVGNVQTVSNYYRDAAQGTLPNVVVGRPERGRQRAPARVDRHRPGLGDRSRQRGHERPGLDSHRDLPGLGRLGRVLRPRRPPAVDGAGYGLRVPALVISALRQAGHHRSPDADRSTPT